MYDAVNWIDHVEDEQGHVIVPGTDLAARYWNQMEGGIQDAHIAQQIIFQHKMQKERIVDGRLDAIEKDIEAEYGSKTLTNTDSYPFNNSAATVALSKVRNTHYTVEAVVTSYSGGLPGNIMISDKAINGFKLAFDGSAKSVTVNYIVKGGLLS